ncbi:MAG: CvpA family protein [Lachnospiraceae bacterium]|nr:CvpA family protein [Lachnospiraceae bacterium]
MEVNFYLIVCVVLLVTMAWWGFRTGLVKSINRFLTWIVVGLGFVLVDMMVRFYRGENTTDAFISFLLFVILILCWRVIRFVLLPVKALTKLPVIHGLDKFLGILFGVLEVLILFWLVAAILQYFEFGRIGDYLRGQIHADRGLTWLYQNNYLMTFEKWLETKLVETF